MGRIHINRPSSTKISYRIRYPWQRKFVSESYETKEGAIKRALKEMGDSKDLQFVEIYKQITADYYDPEIELVCKIKNI